MILDSVIAQALGKKNSPIFDDLTLSSPSNIYSLSHDSFADFLADEHIGHTSITLIAGTGLTGGGDISSSRSFAVDGLLEDLDILGPPSADGEFIVGTGAGAFAYESDNTARTSLGLGTGDSPTFAGATLTKCAVFGANSVVFQPTADSTTFFQVKNAAGTVIPLTIDTSNGCINLKTTPVIQANGTQIIKFDDTNYNVLLGTEVFNNDEGQYNVGIGYQAGYYNDTTGGGNEGKSNVFMGYQAGYGNSGGNTGYRNIGIGYWSCKALIDGFGNVAVGHNSLQKTTTGDANFAFGYESLNNNITGSSNVGIGYQSLNKITASANIGIGGYAYFNMANAGSNVGIGYQAGYRGTAGDDNTLIGTQAGFGVAGSTTFSDNVLIGYRTGYGLTTGSSDVFIGYKSGYRQITNSNLLIIDNQDRGSVAAEITDCLIYGSFNSAPGSQSLRFNLATAIWGNPTHEDTDGGNEIQFKFQAEDSNGISREQARIEACHDGTGTDGAGRIVLHTTTTGNVLTEALRIDSSQDATFAGNIILSAKDIQTDTITGTKIGSATNQKIGFWNANPIVQPSHIADADGTLPDITTKFNTLLAQMAAIGLQASA